MPTDLRATTKLGPKAVPTNLDQMDDILMHALQGPEDDAKQRSHLRHLLDDVVAAVAERCEETIRFRSATGRAYLADAPRACFFLRVA